MSASDLIKQLAWNFRWHIVLALLLMILLGITESVAVITIAPLVDFFTDSSLANASLVTKKVTAVLNGLGVPCSLWTLLGLFLAVYLSKALLSLGSGYVSMATIFAMQGELLSKLFRGFLSTKWDFFATNDQGRLLNTLVNETRAVENAFYALAHIVTTLIQAAFVLVVPFVISWQVTSISLAACMVFAVPTLMLSRLTYRLGQKALIANNEMTGLFQESLGAAKVILSFANQAKSVDALDRSFALRTKALIGAQLLAQGILNAYTPIGITVVIVGLLASRAFSISFSETAVVVYALMRLSGPLGTLASQRARLSTCIPSFEQIASLMAEARTLRQPTGGRKFHGFDRKIEFRNVSFSYPTRSFALKNLCIEIPKGKMIALVGPSGAGKSTVEQLLVGLHVPTSGEITIDGISLSQFDIYSFRHKIGCVPQDSVLFNMSIRENLLWAKSNATEEELLQACKRANAMNFIERMPRKFATIVGERGIMLSGGETQRLALARAILRKPELLILDEATSSLDSHSERLIQEAIENLVHDTTIVIVAHRLSTITHAHYIYVLDDGGVVEKGSYKELYSSNGLFRSMVDLQDLNLGLELTSKEMAVN